MNEEQKQNLLQKKVQCFQQKEFQQNLFDVKIFDDQTKIDQEYQKQFYLMKSYYELLLKFLKCFYKFVKEKGIQYQPVSTFVSETVVQQMKGHFDNSQSEIEIVKTQCENWISQFEIDLKSETESESLRKQFHKFYEEGTNIKKLINRCKKILECFQ